MTDAINPNMAGFTQDIGGLLLSVVICDINSGGQSSYQQKVQELIYIVNTLIAGYWPILFSVWSHIIYCRPNFNCQYVPCMNAVWTLYIGISACIDAYRSAIS